ncbi:methyltransferase [Streptomyces niveiscabiei]|uniref:Methyltransferase n=1 Tax=Streptomyces niveiscabiei TaxID=164115 RepID=A0ABW9HGV8_9ACTN
MTSTAHAPVTAPGPQTATRLRELGMSLGFAAAVRAACELRLADALGEHPATAAGLAGPLGADADTLERLLRALTCHGVFEERGTGLFAHTDLSRLLREDEPGSMRFIVLWATAPWTWRAWPRLADAVRTGEKVFDDLYGKDFFGYLAEDAPQAAETFDRAMTQSSRLTSAPVADALDLGGVTTVADVGGGQGHLLHTLLDRHPALRGTLFDLPGVVPGALPDLREGPLAERCAVIGGDCRETLPDGQDLYLFKNVLEWDDTSSLAALRGVARHGRPGSRVTLVQNLVDASSEAKVTTTMDLFLLLNVGGKKHTAAGLAGLFAGAGLRFDGVRPVPGTSLHLVEGTVPADGAA